MDLTPLLETLSKMTNDRILARADVSKVEDINTVRIPVRFVTEKDRTERTMRRYAADWLRLKLKDIGVETSFEQLPLGMTWHDGTKEIPVLCVITITWWPRPPQPEEHPRRASRS